MPAARKPALPHGEPRPAGRRSRAATRLERRSRAAAVRATLRREDYIAPAAGVGDKMPVLGGDKSSKAKKKPTGERRKPPVTRSSRRQCGSPRCLRRQQPQPQRPPAEPAPQKPDLKLPADAIRAGRAGSNPAVRTPAQARAKAAKTAAGDEVTRSARYGQESVARPRRPQADVAAWADRPRRTRPLAAHARHASVPPVVAEDAGLLGGREQRQINRKRQGSGPAAAPPATRKKSSAPSPSDRAGTRSA